MLTDDVRLVVSVSESGGDINRAIGRGPVEDGPLVFFRIGCGMGAGDLATEDEGVALYIAVVLEAAGSPLVDIF